MDAPDSFDNAISTSDLYRNIYIASYDRLWFRFCVHHCMEGAQEGPDMALGNGTVCSRWIATCHVEYVDMVIHW